MAQEAQHAKEHEKFFENLRSQGLSIDENLKFISLLTKDVLEPLLGPKLNLATTAALEHFTFLLSKLGLESHFLHQAEPELKKLFEWHMAEEIEHRAVAYDVLQYVDSSYILRLQGLIIASMVLTPLTIMCTADFLKQDGLLKQPQRQEIFNELRQLFFKREKLFSKGFVAMIRYLAPHFHPAKENDMDQITEQVLNSLSSRVA
jgi:hypothetical protein